MAYRIDYGNAGKIRKQVRHKLPTLSVRTIVLVSSLVIGAVMIKIIGLTWVQEVLLPGDPAVTAEALHNMTDSLRSGDSILEAVTTFCREIIANAQ